VLDFDSSSLGVDFKFDLNRDDTWFVDLSYMGAMLFAPEEDYDEFYTYGLANLSIAHRRQLGSSPVQFGGSLGTSWRHGDPSEFDRATLYVTAGLLYSPVESVQFAAFIWPDLQFYLNDPNDSSRTDLNFNAGASATWTPTDYLTFGVTATFTNNSSSVRVEDYDVFLPSIVISARISF